MEDFSEKIIGKIAEGKVTPRPRWQFLLRNCAVWALFALTLVIGSITVATIITLVAEHDWGAYRYLNQSFFAYLAASLPYIWLAILTLFTAVTFYDFRKTKKGYRPSPYLVIFATVLLTVLLGSALFAFGFGEETHEFLSENIPFYDQLVYTNEDIWSNAGKGFLIGRLTVNHPTSSAMIVRDFNDRIWNVILTSSSEIENTSLNMGEKLLISGRQGGGTIFLAKEIRPWSGQADDILKNGQ